MEDDNEGSTGKGRHDLEAYAAGEYYEVAYRWRRKSSFLK
jgi:hypothetical protein